jgi:hypothetical protein
VTVSLSFLRSGTLAIPMDGSNQTTALQAAIDTKSTAGGGLILLGPGTVGLSGRLYLKERVVLRGAGKRLTKLQALAGFPTNQPVVTLGTGGGPGSGPGGSTPFAFDTRLEDLEIDANNIAGSKCVFSNELQEGSGAHRCLLNNARLYGIDFVAGCANISLIDNEVYTSASQTSDGVGMAERGISLVSVPGSNLIMRNTVVGLNVIAASKLNWALYTQNTEANIFGIHGERCKVVAVLGANTAGTCLGVSTSAGSAPAEKMVQSFSDTWFVGNITSQNATYAYENGVAGLLYTHPFVGAVVPTFRIEGTARVTEGTAAPTTGTWRRRDRCWNNTPSANSPSTNPPGWICVTDGTPGTWKAMAPLAA